MRQAIGPDRAQDQPLRRQEFIRVVRGLRATFRKVQQQEVTDAGRDNYADIR